MKKIYSYVMLAAVAAAALVSCAKELDKPEVAPKEEGIQIKVVAGGVETKTALTGVNTVGWTAGDKVGFINGEADVNVESSAAVIDGEGKATFTGTVATAGTYYAYYPFQEDGTYAPDPEGVTVRILNTQNPTPTTFDPRADLLVSDAFEATVGSYDTPASIKFKRLSGVIRVQFIDGTTGTKLTGEYATTVGIESSNTKIVGRLKISGTSGLIDPNSGYKSITATYAADTYSLTTSGQYAYFGIKPVTLPTGSTLTFTANTGAYTISKTVTLTSDVTIGSGDILPINVTLLDADVTAKSLKIERLWGKYSTAGASWNEYYGGTAGAERNVTLDDDYVYIPETGTKKLWAISIADPSVVNSVDVTAVLDEGTFKISCPRVIKNTDPTVNGGKDVLVVSNMNSGDPKLYFYVNGIDNPAKVVSATTWASRRLGDTFTYAGTLQDGVFFFKDFNSAEGTVTFPLKYKSTTTVVYLTARLVAPAVTGAGSFFPYPGQTSDGVSSVRGGGVAQLVDTDANFLSGGTEGGVTPTLTNLSGYYTDAAFRFFEFKGKRYIAYTRQVDGSDGRLFIIDGSTSDDWSTILTNRHIVYHAAIQNSTEQEAAPGDASPKSSGNSGMDLDIREAADAVYIAVVKQNVGLSLFKLSLI